MKRITILAIFTFSSTVAFSQGLRGVQQFAGANDNSINGMTTDGAGNIYVVGTYSGIIDFDPGPATVSSPNSIGSDIWLGKYSPSGAYIWAIAVPGNGNDYGQDIAVDNGNPANVYITGTFYDGAFGLTGFTNPGAHPDLSQTMFITKYNGSAGLLWAKAIGVANGITNGRGIAIDKTLGYLYVTGGFTNVISYNDISVDFDPSSSIALLNSNPNGCIFLARYNPSDGSYVQARNFGSSDNSDSWSNDVYAENGYVYLTGIFRNSVNFGSGVLNEGNGKTSFVAKFSYNNLSSIWADNSEIINVGNRIAVNTDISLPNEPIVYVVGSVAPFGVGLISIDNNRVTNEIQMGDTAPSQGQSIALDAAGNIYISGITTGTSQPIVFDPINTSPKATFTLPSGKTDFFLASYNPTDLGANWAMNLNNSQSPGLSNYAANNLQFRNGKIILAGSFNGSANFTSCGSSTVYNSTAMDGYIAEYNSSDANSMSIGGPANLCVGNQQPYTLQNQGIGESITWSLSPSADFVGATSGSGNSVTPSPVSTVSGQATISFISSCHAISSSAPLFSAVVGKPSFSSITLDGNFPQWYANCSAGSIPYTTQPQPHILEAITSGSSSTTFTLNDPSNSISAITLSPTQYSFTTKRTDLNFSITLSTTNGCGTATQCIYFSNGGTCSPPQFTSIKVDGVSANHSSDCGSGANTYIAPKTHTLTASTTGSTSTTFSLSVFSGTGVTGHTVSSTQYSFTTNNTAAQFQIYLVTTNACGTTHECVFFCNGSCVYPASAVQPPQTTFSASPNPSSTTLTVQVSDSLGNLLDQPYQLNLIDKSGMNLFSIQSSEKSLDIPVSNLPPDIYYLNLFYKGAVLQRKIVINR